MTLILATLLSMYSFSVGVSSRF